MIVQVKMNAVHVHDSTHLPVLIPISPAVHTFVRTFGMNSTAIVPGAS